MRCWPPTATSPGAAGADRRRHRGARPAGPVPPPGLARRARRRAPGVPQRRQRRRGPGPRSRPREPDRRPGGPKPYAALQSMLNAMDPKGCTATGRPSSCPGCPAGSSTPSSSALDVTSPPSQAMLVHLGGALNDHEADDGAVGNRDARYIGGFDGAWPPGAPGDAHVAWARDAWGRIRPTPPAGATSTSSSPRRTARGPPPPTAPTTSASTGQGRPTTPTTCSA